MGEQFDVVVEPAEGYGDRNEGLMQKVPRSEFDGIDELEVGMQFRVDSDVGPMVITIVEVADDEITVDGNHPLAGVRLHFDVTVREVREATAEELDHGHAHEPDGEAHE